MDVHRIAAFTYAGRGGNPAGVVRSDCLPASSQMQAIAADIGYSETVFSAPRDDGSGYRVRFFAPDAEVAFCGHATVALGAVLAAEMGDGTFHLELNEGSVAVDGWVDADGMAAAFCSPPTGHSAVPLELQAAGLALFGLSPEELDPDIPVAIVEAGVRHLLLPLRDRDRLAAMRYDMPTGATLMRDWGLTTFSLVQAERPDRYHARNPFAIGGVYEDPATGAGAAALAAYLGALGIIGAGPIEVIQGEDMGVPCMLHATPPPVQHGSARVTGRALRLDVPARVISSPQ
jgi:PhzF family phenazine biosynthesis protein